MNLITQLNKNELIRGLPKISFEKDKICEACQMGKQKKLSPYLQRLSYLLN